MKRGSGVGLSKGSTCFAKTCFLKIMLTNAEWAEQAAMRILGYYFFSV